MRHGWHHVVATTCTVLPRPISSARMPDTPSYSTHTPTNNHRQGAASLPLQGNHSCACMAAEALTWYVRYSHCTPTNCSQRKTDIIQVASQDPTFIME